MSPRIKKLTRAGTVLIVALAALWIFYPTLFAWVVSAAEFHKILEGPTARGATMWKGASYCGTSGEYAIFCNRMKFQLTSYYKVPRDEVRGFPDFPFTIMDSKWVDASRCAFEDGKIVAEDPSVRKKSGAKKPSEPPQHSITFTASPPRDVSL